MENKLLVLVVFLFSFCLSVPLDRKKRETMSELRRVACFRNPTLPYCVYFQSTENTVDSFINETENRPADGGNETTVSVKSNPIKENDQNLFVEPPTDVEEPTIIETTTFEPATPPPTTSGPPSAAQQISTYCGEYKEHYEYFCADPAAHNNRDVENFCPVYKKACIKKKKLTQQDVKDYCRKYRMEFDYFCFDPLEHGDEAIRFCPTFSVVCRASLPNVKPTLPSADKPKNGVLQLCLDNKDLAEQFCFLDPVPSIAERQCNLYQQFC